MASDSPRAACKSKSSRAQTVRIVHVRNPRVVKASASEFRAVVQSLTGQKRSSTSATHHDLSSQGQPRDSCEKPQAKLPRLKGHLQDCSILNIPQPETTPAVFSDRNNRDGGIRWNVQLAESNVRHSGENLADFLSQSTPLNSTINTRS